MNFQKNVLGFLLLSALGAALSGLQGCGSEPPPVPVKPGGLQVGDRAPDFALMDSTGHLVKSSDIQPGWYLVVILYRGSWCSACQNQLLNLKDDYPKFIAAHTALVAISVDPIEDSANFNNQWRFPFPLLSDPQLQVIDAFGARHPHGHGNKDIARPTTLIIGPDKIIRYKYIGRDPVDRPSDDEIIFTIQQLEKQKKIS